MGGSTTLYLDIFLPGQSGTNHEVAVRLRDLIYMYDHQVAGCTVVQSESIPPHLQIREDRGMLYLNDYS